MHFRHLLDDLARLERCQGFTGAGGMPDIGIVRAVFNLVYQGFRGVKLIRPQHLNHLLFGHDHIIGHHVGDMARF
jgi:hypothetical protein